MPTDRPTIYAIDFDGTIALTDFPTILSSIQPVESFIKRLQRRGDKWILWTMREGSILDEAVAWCRSYGLFPDAVNDNLPDMKEKWGNNPRKVFADFYIDDHNAGGMFLPRIADADEGEHMPMPIDHRCCGNCKWMTRVYEECLCENHEQSEDVVYGHYVCDLFEM